MASRLVQVWNPNQLTTYPNHLPKGEVVGEGKAFNIIQEGRKREFDPFPAYVMKGVKFPLPTECLLLGKKGTEIKFLGELH